MRAGQDAVERDAAAQRAFAHVDAFPMRPAASPKGDFQVKAAVAGAHGVGAVQLGGAAVMGALPSPLLFGQPLPHRRGAYLPVAGRLAARTRLHTRQLAGNSRDTA